MRASKRRLLASYAASTRFLSQLASVLHYASSHAGARTPGYPLRRPKGSWGPRHYSDDAKKQSAAQPSAAAPIKLLGRLRPKGAALGRDEQSGNASVRPLIARTP